MGMYSVIEVDCKNETILDTFADKQIAEDFALQYDILHGLDTEYSIRIEEIAVSDTYTIEDPIIKCLITENEFEVYAAPYAYVYSGEFAPKRKRPCRGFCSRSCLGNYGWRRKT